MKMTLPPMARQAECAEALMRAGCDAGMRDKTGRTGRELAELQGHTAMLAQIRVLLVAAASRSGGLAAASREAEQLALAISEKVGPEVGPTSAFFFWLCFLLVIHGPTCVFWTNLTPSSL
jgi:hypothetical protein